MSDSAIARAGLAYLRRAGRLPEVQMPSDVPLVRGWNITEEQRLRGESNLRGKHGESARSMKSDPDREADGGCQASPTSLRRVSTSQGKVDRPPNETARRLQDIVERLEGIERSLKDGFDDLSVCLRAINSRV